MEPSLVRVVPLAAAAWTAALTCILVSVWHARRVRRRASPGVDALIERARAEAGTGDPVVARPELAEIAAEAERGLTLALMLPRSLPRIALASGTAFALLIFASGGGATALAIMGALVAFVGGAFGMVGSLIFGQQASSAAVAARAEWRAHVREAQRRLAAEIEKPA